jgi:hypothetical protein
MNTAYSPRGLAAAVNGGGSARGRGSRTDHCSGILPNRWWSALKASMAAEALRSSGYTASAFLRSSASFHGARGSPSSGTARSGLPPPPAPPSSTNCSPAAAPGRRRGNRGPWASSLPPAPFPSSFPLSSSSLAVDRARSPSGGGRRSCRRGGIYRAAS